MNDDLAKLVKLLKQFIGRGLQALKILELLSAALELDPAEMEEEALAQFEQMVKRVAQQVAATDQWVADQIHARQLDGYLSTAAEAEVVE